MKKVLPVLVAIVLVAGMVSAQELKQPPVISAPAGKAPSDAIVLLDGTSLREWQHTDGSAAKWDLQGGAMVVKKGTGGVMTKKEFGDMQLHLEFATPSEVVGEGQGRGNSGVYLQGVYEVQVLDSYENETYPDGMLGAVYQQYIPLVNAARKPGEWQTYDFIFRAPRFGAGGKVTEKAVVTVILNGVLIQDHIKIAPTPGGIRDNEAPTGPIFLQDHGNPTRFRNIWVREL